ncbi:MAG: RluA family pseudouridine synthase [Bacilli bacterium]|nr:RluA family pseudouridine synthase [Bacilli bacterium]
MKSLDEIIIYKDDNIVILNKPSFLLSQKDGTGEVSLEDYVQEYFRNKNARLINRLDKDTTGLIVFGLNEPTIKYFNEVFSNHEKVEKKYLTLVSGQVTEPGEVNAPIRKNFQLKKMVVASEKNGGKKALTLYKPINVFDDTTLLEVTLKTGRTHQIRVHMSYIRHHVIGDYKYGDFKINNKYKNEYGLTTQFLHSYSLTFNCLDGKYKYLDGKHFVCDLPEGLKNILNSKVG